MKYPALLRRPALRPGPMVVRRIPWCMQLAGSCFVAGALALSGAAPALAQGAQGGVVTGQVTDASTKAGIASATVEIEGTRLGAVADHDGRFRIVGVPAGAHTLVVSSLGYTSVRQPVTVAGDQPTEVTIALEVAAISLDELVVTGTAGAQQRREIGNSIAIVNAGEQLSKSQAPDLGTLLNARAPGVTITPSTGRLGAGPNIRIRGVSSLGLDNNPLIYIDGVRVSNAVGTGPGGSGGFGAQNAGIAGRLNDINPDEIESIQIIKGPAAATIYGTEAANGVVQIITKKGGGTEPQVRLKIENGFIYFRDAEGRLPTNVMPDSTGALVRYNGIAAQEAAETPVFEKGQVRRYNLSLSGGLGQVNYFVSGDYEHDLGIEPNNSLRQFGGHANLDLVVNPKLSFATSLNYVKATNHLGVDVGLSSMLGAEFAHPLLFSVPGAAGFYPNVPPQVPQTLFDNSDRINRFTGGVTIDHRPTGWFSHRLIVGLDHTGSDARALEKFAPPDLAPFTLGNAAGRIGQLLTSTNLATADYSATAAVNLTSDLTSSLSVGGQFYRTETNQSFLGGIGFPGPGITTVSGTAKALQSAQASVVNTTIGGYVQEELGLSDRFFLTGALRVDNNSAFGEEFKLITYPKVGASWVISEEPFWNIGFIDALRLRAAYGESGRAPAAFTALRTYTPVQGPGGTNAFTAGSYGNLELEPERGKEFEAGFESQLFNNRLSLDFTYYNKHTTNEIVAQPVAPSTGFFGNQLRNLGQVNNHGMELRASLQVLTGSTLAWEIAGNVSTAKNRIVSLGDIPSLITAAGQENIVGYPIQSYFSRRVVSAALDPATGAVSDVLCDGGPEAQAPVPCADAPFVYIGTPTPTSTGAIANTVTLFNRLRLYALVDWKRGHKLYNFVEQARCTGILGAGLCDVNYNPQDYAPEYVAEASFTGFLQQTHDRFFQDASFVKLREVSATYTLPERLALGLQHASVTLAARELAIWTDYPGVDPEVNYAPTGLIAVDQGVIPPLSRITLTLNLTF